ncbi:MAG: hypothetical protein ACJATI_004076 [Halioglobus sp.]|jgi:hypothetical protein
MYTSIEPYLNIFESRGDFPSRHDICPWLRHLDRFDEIRSIDASKEEFYDLVT